MKLNSLLFRFTACALLYPLGISAQEKPDTKKPEGSLTEEIVVERPYKPVLADASKIRRSPDLSTSKNYKTELKYALSDKRLDLNSEIKQLQAQKAVEDALKALKNNYIKAGFGNFKTALGEIYINNGPDEGLQLGAFAKHLSLSGDLEKQKFSHQQAAVFGKSILDQTTLNGAIGFDKYSTFLYGQNPATKLPFTADPSKKWFSTVSLMGEILKNPSTSEDELDYALKADIYALSDNYDGKERSLVLSGLANKKWNIFNIGLDASLELIKTKDSATTFNSNSFKASPYIKLQDKNYMISAGVNLTQDFGTESKFHLFPSIAAEVAIVPENASLFAGYTGNSYATTLKDLSEKNPFLHERVEIKSMTEDMNAYGGIKGNAGSAFGYKASITFKKLKDMPLFLNNRLNPESFDIVYDDIKMHTLSGEVDIQVSEVLNVGGKLELNGYKTTKEEKPWHMPDMRLVSTAKVNIIRQLNINAELIYNGQSFSQGIAPDFNIVKLKSYMTLSTGVDYTYKDKVGAFLKVNNIFGNEYQRYLYYPQVGLNVVGGLTFSF